MSKTQSLLQPDPKRWKALALLGFANFIVMMDSAVVQVALPSIKDALGYTEANVWSLAITVMMLA